MSFVLQVGAFKIFVPPSLTCPHGIALATHDLCADGGVTSGAATSAEMTREAHWVDIYLPFPKNP